MILKPRIHENLNSYYVIIDCESREHAKNVKNYLQCMNSVNIDLKYKLKELRDSRAEEEILTGNLMFEMKQQLLKSVVKLFKGNKTKAAQALGVSIRNVRSKINGR